MSVSSTVSTIDTPILRTFYFCSAATAGVFAISALSNGFLFWAAWRTSYFMIASTTDVVMGGFSLFPRFALCFVGVTVFIEVCRRSADWVGARFNIEPLRRQTLEELRAEAHQERLTWLYLALAFALAGTLFLSLWGPAGLNKSAWRLLTHRVAWPMAYHTGLRVAPESKTDKRCLGVDVLWLGSSAAILNCGQGVRVVHDLEGLVTEPNTTLPVEVD